MKNIFKLVCMVILPIYSFSYELTFSKGFQRIINPDLLVANITINVEDKQEDRVNKKIELFNSFIKNSESIKVKTGRYNLSPKYRYYKNKQEFVGYNGYLDYTIEVRKAKVLNEFINKLISLKNDDENIKLNISNIMWSVGEKEEEKSFDTLRLEAIKWINQYSNKLSKEFSKDCKIKKISIGSRALPMPRYRNEMAFSKSAMIQADVSPMQSEQKVSITPTFILECK